MGPKNITLKASWAYIHETHKTIANKEVLVNGQEYLPQREQVEMPISLKGAYLHTLKVAACGSGFNLAHCLGDGGNPPWTSDKPADTYLLSSSRPLQVAGISLQKACTYIWCPSFCSSCQNGQMTESPGSDSHWGLHS